jgi:GntR family transcriptional regulator
MAGLAGKIDRSSPLPFHYQVRKLLERPIETGKWGAGHRLPSEPTLSEHFGVSRTTVRQALDSLVQQGLIRKEKGRGVFVTRRSPSWIIDSAVEVARNDASRFGVAIESAVLGTSTERLPHWAAEALQLPHDAKGLTLERLRRVDGDLALYVVNHLPLEFAGVATDLQRLPQASLYATLHEQFGVKVANSSRVLEAVAAPAMVSRLLEIPRGSPVVFIQSVARSTSGTPVDCHRAWLRTDRLRIALELDGSASLADRVVDGTYAGSSEDGSEQSTWTFWSHRRIEQEAPSSPRAATAPASRARADAKPPRPAAPSSSPGRGSAGNRGRSSAR